MCHYVSQHQWNCYFYIQPMTSIIARHFIYRRPSHHSSSFSRVTGQTTVLTSQVTLLQKEQTSDDAAHLDAASWLCKYCEMRFTVLFQIQMGLNVMRMTSMISFVFSMIQNDSLPRSVVLLRLKEDTSNRTEHVLSCFTTCNWAHLQLQHAPKVWLCLHEALDRQSKTDVNVTNALRNMKGVNLSRIVQSHNWRAFPPSCSSVVPVKSLGSPCRQLSCSCTLNLFREQWNSCHWPRQSLIWEHCINSLETCSFPGPLTTFQCWPQSLDAIMSWDSNLIDTRTGSRWYFWNDQLPFA